MATYYYTLGSADNGPFLTNRFPIDGFPSTLHNGNASAVDCLSPRHSTLRAHRSDITSYNTADAVVSVHGHEIHIIRGRQYIYIEVRCRSRAGICIRLQIKEQKTCTIIRGRRNRINIHFASCPDVYRIYPHE